MNHLDSKQKMIIGVILMIIIGFLCYYVYAKEDNTQVENMLEIESSKTTKENDKDDTIFVHVSGAVNQEGVVELKADSRVADAIEKARRNKPKCSYG